MIREKRVVNNFLEMLKQESSSFAELPMGEWLIRYFRERNIEVFMDQSGTKVGGNCGNIIAHINGTSNLSPLCFGAHMDQISPCKNIKPWIDGNIIKTDGTTTLGGDDKAGIAAILEALEHVLEENIEHRELYLLFTVCEETGLLGAKCLDKNMVPAKDIIFVDAQGPVGVVAYKAPAMKTIEVIFRGLKAHAGVEPEKGINAIKVAADAIGAMNIGRIDNETTANIGKIQGGEATNIVPDMVSIKAEIRSHSKEKLDYQVNHMRSCCEKTADKYNTNFEFKCELEFPSLSLCKDNYVYQLCIKAFEEEGIKPEPLIIGGGSDANILSGEGYNCVIISVGMDKAHTTEETLCISDLVNTSKAIARMMVTN